MFANWCKETSTTTGTGTLTLTAVSNFPRISNAAAVDEQVSYAIVNSSGEPIEAGIGTVGASNTLARTLVKSTYVSGTLTTANASAVTLSGTNTIFTTPIAGTFMGAGNAIYSSAANRFIWSPHAGDISGGDSKALGAGNVCTYVPFLMEFGCDVDALACSVTTLGATNVRMGLYAVSTTGAPGAKLVETSDVSVSATGIKTGTFTRRYLSPGWYFTAVASKGVSCSLLAHRATLFRANPLGMSSGFVANCFANQTLSGGWTSLPAPAGTVTVTAGAIDYPPAIVLRAA